SGDGVIQWKRRWPTWTPPAEMIARQPELEKYSAENGGQPPGLTNPLGARALYIFQNGQDTLYRLHGTPEYWTIGKAVSRGCVRLMNQAIIDLYGRVATPAPIVVPGGAAVCCRPRMRARSWMTWYATSGVILGRPWRRNPPARRSVRCPPFLRRRG